MSYLQYMLSTRHFNKNKKIQKIPCTPYNWFLLHTTLGIAEPIQVRITFRNIYCIPIELFSISVQFVNWEIHVLQIEYGLYRKEITLEDNRDAAKVCFFLFLITYSIFIEWSISELTFERFVGATHFSITNIHLSSLYFILIKNKLSKC